MTAGTVDLSSRTGSSGPVEVANISIPVVAGLRFSAVAEVHSSADDVNEDTVLVLDLDGGSMEGAPVLEPIVHSVPEKPLDGGPMEGAPVLVLEKPLDGEPLKEMSVVEPLEHSVLLTNLNGGPMEGAPVLEPIEHSVLEKPLDGGPMEGMFDLEPLEHSVPVLAPMKSADTYVRTAVSDPLEHAGGTGDVHTFPVLSARGSVYPSYGPQFPPVAAEVPQ